MLQSIACQNFISLSRIICKIFVYDKVSLSDFYYYIIFVSDSFLRFPDPVLLKVVSGFFYGKSDPVEFHRIGKPAQQL